MSFICIFSGFTNSLAITKYLAVPAVCLFRYLLTTAKQFPEFGRDPRTVVRLP
jgi:hypothetical protein